MSQIRTAGSFEYGLAPVERVDDSVMMPSYSRAWQQHGPDMLWPRSCFFGSSVGDAIRIGSSGLEVWDWTFLKATDGKVGQRRNSITGVTRDAAGAALGGCTVRCFDLARNECTDVEVSDADGNFDVTTPYTGQVYLEVYKAGAPNVFGASDNLTPS